MELADRNGRPLDHCLLRAQGGGQPDGRLIAVAPHPERETRAIEIWDSNEGRPVTTLSGQTGELSDIKFSPDGSRLATSGADGSIRFWDVDTGEQQLTLRGPAAVTGISFSPDGSELASYGVDGVVRIWALEPDELVPLARQRVTRDFNDDECRQYLHTARCAVLPAPNDD